MGLLVDLRMDEEFNQVVIANEESYFLYYLTRVDDFKVNVAEFE